MQLLVIYEIEHLLSDHLLLPYANNLNLNGTLVIHSTPDKCTNDNTSSYLDRVVHIRTCLNVDQRQLIIITCLMRLGKHERRVVMTVYGQNTSILFLCVCVYRLYQNTGLP